MQVVVQKNDCIHMPGQKAVMGIMLGHILYRIE